MLYVLHAVFLQESELEKENVFFRFIQISKNFSNIVIEIKSTNKWIHSVQNLVHGSTVLLLELKEIRISKRNRTLKNKIICMGVFKNILIPKVNLHCLIRL